MYFKLGRYQFLEFFSIESMHDKCVGVIWFTGLDPRDIVYNGVQTLDMVHTCYKCAQGPLQDDNEQSDSGVMYIMKWNLSSVCKFYLRLISQSLLRYK